MNKGKLFFTLLLMVLTMSSSIAIADWDPGDPNKMHFPQLPDPEGWDVCLHDQAVADDFICTESGEITDIHFWVSWRSDEEDWANTEFIVEIWDDAGGLPGTVKWGYSSFSGLGSWVVRQPAYQGIQGWHCPSAGTSLYPDHSFYWQINLTDIPEPFVQEAGSVYWLVIRAVKPVWPPAVGWKTALASYQPYPFQSPALYQSTTGGWLPVEPWGQNEGFVDMSFVITNDGEQEQLDCGDAPDSASSPGYPTLLANSGAFHLLDGVTFMGALIDSEPDGQPTTAADGDDLNNLSDEDGVVFNTSLVPGQMAQVTVTASVSGYLDAWVDFNIDGNWNQATDQIANTVLLNSGSNTYSFLVPASASPGQSYARFRFSPSGGLLPGGAGGAGEVEDYAVVIDQIPDDPNVKWIQWPDLTSNGIDIRVDESDGVVRHIADDFLCNQTGPITDVHFWGSWKDDSKGHINSLVISIYSDDPVGLGGSDPDNQYSMPDQLLWQGQYYDYDIFESLYYELSPEFEWWWDPYFGDLEPDGDQMVWKYDIYIDPLEAFIQEGTEDNPVVYWLELQANMDYGDANDFGWKTSIDHWNDDAVFANGATYPYVSGWSELRYPSGHPENPNSIDMAFIITTGEMPNEPNYKWVQEPDLSELGIDIKATEPFILADDFECNETNYITEITVWGSWKNDVLPAGGADDVKFTLSLHSDIPDPDPADPCTYSMPGDILWVKMFEPMTYEVSIEKSDILEGWWTPDDPQGYIFPGDTICFKYVFTIDPNEAFVQLGEPNEPIVYWLDVQASPNDPTGEAEFGWKTSLDHWNDDAVWGFGLEPYLGPWNELRYPAGHELHPESLDLAFAIGTSDLTCRDMMQTSAELALYDRYTAAGNEPHCWCCRYQCHGDGDCAEEYLLFVGNLRIYNNDLGLVIANWKGTPETGANPCADFDHAEEYLLFVGNLSVYNNDLGKVIANWKATSGSLTDCPTWLP